MTCSTSAFISLRMHSKTEIKVSFKMWSSKRNEIIIRNIIIIILLIPLAVLIYNILVQIFSRMAEELTLSYTADAPIYWTVCKGILNGFKPYQDFYETKPPGIFLISALSFAITGDSFVTNIFCFISLIIIGLSPAAFVILYHSKNKCKNMPYILLSVFSALLFGIILMRSGAAQVESFGAAAAIVYILLISFIDGKNTSYKSPLIWISALFLMLSVMMKEPFLLVCIACALLFINSIKDLIKKLILPLIAGGGAGIILMLATGTFIPYLKYYLPNMLGSHVSRYGSPIARGFNFKVIFNDLGKFSACIQALIILLVVGVVILTIYRQYRRDETSLAAIAERIYHILKLFVIFYLTAFAVGLGGQYYNHHFVFAVPIYFALFCVFIADFNRLAKSDSGKYKVGAVCFFTAVAIISSAASAMLPKYEYDKQKVDNSLVSMHQDAAYVDQVLDTLGEERYQYFGFNGNVFYCFTTHLPQGPVFFQDPYNFSFEDNWFSQNLINQLNNCNVVIVQKINVGVLNDYVKNYLEENFTTTPPENVTNISLPKNFNYKIYFRK